MTDNKESEIVTIELQPKTVKRLQFWFQLVEKSMSFDSMKEFILHACRYWMRPYLRNVKLIDEQKESLFKEIQTLEA